MMSGQARTTFCFSAIASCCILIGGVGAIVGAPAFHGLTTSEALPIIGSRAPIATGLWVAYTLVVLLLSILRARFLARRKPWVHGTLVRGSMWIWAAVGLPWFAVYIAWDLPLFENIGSDLHDHGSFAGSLAIVWWAGSALSAVVAAGWSVWLESRRRPTTSWHQVVDATPPTCADAPGVRR